MLELKRRDDARVQTEMVEFIALQFPSSKKKKKLKIWSFHVVVLQGRPEKCTKIRDARAKFFFLLIIRQQIDFDICYHQEYARLPSRYEAFVDNKPEWINDKHFTQQRLAGPNPMSLRRVTVHGQGTSLPTRPVVA